MSRLDKAQAVAAEAYRNRARLAEFEFRTMMEEIHSGFAFELNTGFGSRPLSRISAHADILDVLPPPGMTPLLPPLGKIAAVTENAPSVCAAILVEDVPNVTLGQHFVAFMTEHNFRPFLRPLFLCESMAPLPFLARYGFAALPLQGMEPIRLTQALAPRFALHQLRALSDGRLIWQQKTP